uniref:Uncharacterized protein n=1 Tax=Arundo donax TaxID=35708 RepID=A0A0A9DQD5_ARUDO
MESTSGVTVARPRLYQILIAACIKLNTCLLSILQKCSYVIFVLALFAIGL